MKKEWLLSIGLLGAAVLQAADLGSRTSTEWAVEEWELSNPGVEGNPFDVEARAVFTHRESGEKRRTGMFYDGEDRWKFRFCGSLPGEWTFETVSEDPDLNGHRGTVQVSEDPEARGHLSALGPKGQKWSWEGTGEVFTPQLGMIDYRLDSRAPSEYASPEAAKALVDFYLQDQGFNGLHQAAVTAFWFDYENRSDKNRVSKDMTNPDLRTFAALENLIRHTYEAGGMLHIWAWGDQQRGQVPENLAGGANGKEDQRLQRYIAARLGPLPGWSMGYGFDLQEWVDENQINTWRNYIQEECGWFHFFGGRAGGPISGTDHARWSGFSKNLDYASYQHHKPTYAVYVAALEEIPDRPAFSEDRFRIRNPPRYPRKDYDDEWTRRTLYRSTMAGGVANIFGRRENGGRYSEEGVQAIKGYRTFFDEKKRFLPDMVRANELSTDENTRVLHSPGTQSYVLYREDCSEIQIDLSGAKVPLKAVAVDTRAAYREVDLGKLSPSAQSLKLPHQSDWVIAVSTP